MTATATRPVDYHRYLASREWRLKRRQVAERSGGVCERCKVARATDVHHLSYADVRHERLEDLLHLCRPCHRFESAESDHDPLELKERVMAARIAAQTKRLAEAEAGDPDAITSVAVLKEYGRWVL